MKLSLNRSDNVETPWLDEGIVESLRKISVSLGPDAQIVNLVFVDDPYIREINKEFRNIDRATDVISFSYIDDEGPNAGDDLAGEIYVSSETIEKEAKELGVSPKVLFLRVSVHGLLHVIGFDHEGEQDTARMEQKERSILENYLNAAQLDSFF